MHKEARKLSLEYAYVNAYLITRKYGGPEEGGWWYDSGQPLGSIPVKLVTPYELEYEVDEYGDTGEDDPLGEHVVIDKLSNADAEVIDKHWDYLTETFKDMNDPQPLYNVNSEGKVVIYIELKKAEYWPRNRPHYE